MIAPRHFATATLAALVLVGHAGAAAARCGAESADAVAAARAQVETECGCARAASHALYVHCALSVARTRAANGLLPKSCKRSVKRCAAKSVCGKRNAVTCCITRKGRTKCRIKKKAAKCLAKGGCVGIFPSCCDACTATGCRTLSTSSSTSTTITPTTTSTTTTTFAEGQLCDQFVAPDAPEEPLPCGGTVACQLDPAGDTDRFIFSLPAGAAVSISITGSKNPCWQLVGPGGPVNGQPVCKDIGSLDGLSAGSYSITVSENAIPEMTDYVLSLQGVSAAYHCGTPLNLPSDTRSDSLTPAGDTDSYNFTAEAGQTATIAINGDHNPCWRVFAPDGTPVMAQRCRTDGATQTPMLVAGLHTIVVSELTRQTSDYTLSVTVAP
jgi:hypothetical protein